MNPSNLTSPILDISATAYACDGVCSMSTDPCAATIRRLVIAVTVSDPDHRLFRISGLALGPHPDARTSTQGPKVLSIQSPGAELVFEASTGTGATTSIQIYQVDPWQFFGQMLDAGIVDVDGGRRRLTIDLLYRFLRHRVETLVGFEGLSLKRGRQPELSIDAATIVAEMGDDLRAPLRFNAVLQACLERPGLCCDYPQVEREVRAHASHQFGLRLEDYLPNCLGSMRQSCNADCGKLPHPGMTKSNDRWLLTASPESSSFQPASIEACATTTLA